MFMAIHDLGKLSSSTLLSHVVHSLTCTKEHGLILLCTSYVVHHLNSLGIQYFDSTDCHQYCHNSLLDLDRVEETVRLSEEGANDGRNVARGNKLDAFYDNDEEVQISLRSKEHKVMNSMHCVNKNLSVYPQKYASRIKELAIEKEDLVRDIQLMEEIVNHQHVFLEEIGHGLTSLENISAFEKLVDGCITKRKLKPKNAASVDLSCFNTINKMNSFPRMELDHESSLTSWNKSADNQSDYIVQDETSILVDFLNIKNQFIQLLDTLDKSTEASHMIFSQKESSYRDQRLDSHTQNISRLCSYANCISSSELCRPLVQALIKIDAKLHPLADRISFVHLGLDGTHSMLEKLFENMCQFERKVYMYEENLSELDKHKSNLISQNIQLSSGLGHRDAVMQGLLFDLRLLQESTSNVKDRKEETEKLSGTLRQTRNSLAVRASDIDCILSRQQRIEQDLTDKEVALECLQSDFRKAQEVVELLTNENAELRTLLDDLYLKKHDFEEQLVEQNEVIECLKKELLSLSATVEQKIINSVRDSEDQLKKVISERDLLLKEVAAMRCELEASLALADENETMAIEARQVSESCKIHAEQKEEEARVLEQSVEELDHTIEMFEKKVFEMSNEVERQKLMREELELEMHDLKLRLMDPQIVAGDLDKESLFYLEEGRDSIILRHLEERRNELLEAKQHIHKLEKEKADQAEKYKGYIAELLFHSEAQASHYQEKYKDLEDMVESQHCIHLEDLTANRREHVSGRRRGSGSPFKCITGLINNTNFEKDHELFVARTRMKELEGLAANRQKEVCVLNARLAIAESMTHDVVRDLLGVKLDLSTYVDQFDEQLVQRLVESVRKQSEESRNKEHEFLKLEAQLGDLIKDRERLLEENNQKKSEVLDFQLRVEQLRQSQQLLAAQNELLKMDKQKLKKKIEEMNEMLKTCGLQEFSQQFHHQSKNKENRPLWIRDNDLEYQNRRDSQKRSSHMKDEPPNRFGRVVVKPSSAFNDLQRRQ